MQRCHVYSIMIDASPPINKGKRRERQREIIIKINIHHTYQPIILSIQGAFG